MTATDKPVLAVLDVLPSTSRAVLEARFGPEFEIVYARENSEAARRAAMGDATAALVVWSPVEASVIEAATDCRVVQKLGIGVDKIDLAAARRCAVAVLLAAGVNAEAVAEMTVLLMLTVARDLILAVQQTRSGGFPKEDLRERTFQLFGRTVGLVGFGHIGRCVARRLTAFGAEVLYYETVRALPQDEAAHSATYVTLDELLARSDVVSLHVPATAATRGLVDTRFLSRMKSDALLINTSRGSLVDEEALALAIGQGRLLGAGLDVTSVEPLPGTSPLWGLDRVVITPHVSGAVADNFPRVVEHAYRNVAAVLRGEQVSAADVACWPG